MSKHTAGPWKVEVGGSERDIIVTDKQGRTIAETNASCYSEYEPGVPDMTAAEALANAKLIAQAPALIAKLKSVTENLRFTLLIMTDPETRKLAGKILEDAYAVIAETEGRQV